MSIQTTTLRSWAKSGAWRTRFGLGSLMVGVAVVAVFFAFWRAYVQSYQSELRTVTKIRALRDRIQFDSQAFTEPRGQYIFRQFFGDRLSQRVIFVHLHSEDVNDAWIEEHLSGLGHVEVLTLDCPNVTDAGLAQLRGLKSLQRLTLARTRVTDDGVEKLRRSLPQLMRIDRRP